MKKFLEMEEQLKANAAFMQDYDKTFEERLAEAKARDKDYSVTILSRIPCNNG